MTTTVEGFVRKLERASSATGPAARAGVEAAGKYLTKALLVSLGADTHGTLRLRGVKNGEMGATSRTVGAGGETTSVLVRGIPGGLWSWLQKGTSPHVVGAGRGKVGISRNIHGVVYAFDKKNRKTYTAKRLRIGATGDWALGPFVAGGSPARRTFTRAVDVAHPGMVKAMQTETRARVLEAFKHG